MHRKVSFEKRLYAPAEREDAPLRAAPVGSALAVDGQPVGLPVDLRALEGGELGDTQAGVEERPDDELLEVRRAGAFASWFASSPVSGSRLYW